MTIMHRAIRSSLWLALIALVPAAVSWTQLEHPDDSELMPGEVRIDDSSISGADTVWIDARDRSEFESGHADGAVSLTEDEWDAALGGVFEQWEPGRAIVVYCDAGCAASSKVAERLRELGMDPVYVLKGGYQAWKSNQN